MKNKSFNGNIDKLPKYSYDGRHFIERKQETSTSEDLQHVKTVLEWFRDNGNNRELAISALKSIHNIV